MHQLKLEAYRVRGQMLEEKGIRNSDDHLQTKEITVAEAIQFLFQVMKYKKKYLFADLKALEHY